MAVLKQDDHTAGRDIYGSHGDAWETLRFADPSHPTDPKPADLLYNFIDGTSANNAQDGTNRDDVYRGGFKDNTFHGRDGDDHMFGQNDQDHLYGEDGNDHGYQCVDKAALC
jgi:Ca2+-binding RTX toxin-like protein